MKKFTFIALLATLLCGCAQFADDEVNTQKIVAPESIEASFEEPSSRTYVENDRYLRWTAGDEISYFPGVTFNMEYRFTGVTGANNGSFSKVTVGPVTGNELSRNYAIYPYDEDIAVSDEGVISLNIPAVQKYAENSFGVGANTMVAATNGINDEVLKFRNVGGYLKIKLYGDDVTVKSVKLQGNNNEKIAGPALITATYGNDPTVVMTAEATTSVTIDCEEGVTISNNSETPTEFWFVLPTVTFEDGFTITVTDINDGTFVKSTSNTFTIDRNMIQPMKELNAIIEGGSSPEPEPEPDPVGPANNEIWYTNGSTTVPTDSFKKTVFGANYVSNIYDAEKGCWVITFDGDVTTIGDSAFAFSSITSICIPNGVTSIHQRAFQGCSSLESFSGKFASDDHHCLVEDGLLKGIALAGLTAYTLPNSIISIPDQGIDCVWFASLEKITIPNSVVSIGNYFLAESTHLKEVVIGESVVSIGDNAFGAMYALEKIYFKAMIPPTFGNPVLYDVNRGDVDIYVPNDSRPKYIASDVFVNNSIIGYDYINGKVAEPLQVADIANNEIWYTATEKYESLGASGFDVDIVAHGWNAASGEGVIVFDGDVSIIKICAFVASPFVTVTLPNSVTSVENGAFVLSESLQEFRGKFSSNYGYSLICNNVFVQFATAGYDGEIFVIPEGITKIGDYAFFKSSISSVTIPDSVEMIGTEALNSCLNLKEVYCKPITPPNGISYYTFDRNASGRKIYVPASDDDSVVNAYKAAEGWKEYADAIEEYEFE
ncbi:MAG: leucine-rich repeat domain-containing protein [Tidjanibacter sp.]|nr:leucine-rich repeat domain-containing protein [Tidjanibacter sp.]